MCAFITAEDVQPIGGGGPGSRGLPPRTGQGAARGDPLPGVALRSPKLADTACYAMIYSYMYISC